MLSACIMQPRRSGMAAWPRPNARRCRSSLADGPKATPAISQSGPVYAALLLLLLLQQQQQQQQQSVQGARSLVR